MGDSVADRSLRVNDRRMMVPDPARMRRATGGGQQRNFEAWGIVGHTDKLTGLPEPTPSYVRIENGQIFVECTIVPDGDQIVARLGMDGAGDGLADYFPLEFGCRVVIDMINGNPQNAVIRSCLNDANGRFPDDVAGVQTGAVGAVTPGASVPAPLWRFLKLAPGQLLAFETQEGGDVLLHSAGSTHLKAGPAGAHHLEGTVHLGVGPTTPPVGQTVGPAGVPVPGVPAVPHIPVPATPSIPATPATIVPYIGFEDGVVRSKDAVQSYAAVDPAFWTFITALFAHPLIGPVIGGVPPIALHSEHGGRNGPGSSHTASD